MDKLESYLDQVCRGIAGPRSLRQHIRQELREHLLDAAAEHKQAGLAEEEALAKALEDFGGPEEVGGELQATHGQRVMAVVIDKAMQWKEMTMKAKWLWTTWAHVALGLIIVGEILFVYGAMVFVVPKFHQLADIGWLDAIGPHANRLEAWSFSFLMSLAGVCQNGLWVALGVAFLSALFEWRIRSEHKTQMRLAAMSTAALGLLVVMGLTAFAVGIPPYIEIPPDARHRAAGRIVAEQLWIVDSSVDAIQDLVATKDWQGAARRANEAQTAFQRIQGLGSEAVPALAPLRMSPWPASAKDIQAAGDTLREMTDAVNRRDRDAFEAAFRKFDEAYRRGVKGDLNWRMWPPPTTTKPAP